VRVECDGTEAALGTIVRPDGWILTKASQLQGRIVCRGRDRQEWEARRVGVDPEYDLAMLKIDAAGLPKIAWSPGPDPAVGQWVATPGVEGDSPLAIGVVSVPRRRIPPARGMLGIAVGDAKGGARIVRIRPESPAQEAGLEVDDVITHVDGRPALGNAGLIAAIGSHRPGEVVRLTVRRAGEVLEVSATLMRNDSPGSRKREAQNQSAVGISKRHDDFPMVLQHDTVLRPVDCGGPLVDLGGKVIGVNIARGGRTETYCVPSDLLLPLMDDLMAGDLASSP
jgi:serine protease Do